MKEGKCVIYAGEDVPGGV